jgi:arginase family enzyme
VHFDVDVLNPDDALAVSDLDSRGATPAALRQIFQSQANQPLSQALSITQQVKSGYNYNDH